MIPSSLKAQTSVEVVRPTPLPQLKLVRDATQGCQTASPALSSQCANCMMHWACITAAVPSTQQEQLNRMVHT